MATAPASKDEPANALLAGEKYLPHALALGLHALAHTLDGNEAEDQMLKRMLLLRWRLAEAEFFPDGPRAKRIATEACGVLRRLAVDGQPLVRVSPASHAFRPRVAVTVPLVTEEVINVFLLLLDHCQMHRAVPPTDVVHFITGAEGEALLPELAGLARRVALLPQPAK